MPNQPPDPSAGNQHLDEVVTAYLKAVEAGHTPDQQAWLARYPELASELAAFFAGQNQVEKLAAAVAAGIGSQHSIARCAHAVAQSDAAQPLAGQGPLLRRLRTSRRDRPRRHGRGLSCPAGQPQSHRRRSR